MTAQQLHRRPGSAAMPLHIDRVGPHYIIYEVYLGGLSYYGTYTPEEFLSWLDQNIEDRGKRTTRPAATASALNINLQL